MKNLILLTLVLVNFSAFANNPLAEINGDAARARTAEARNRANAARAAIASTNQAIAAKRAEIEATKAQMAADKVKMEAWHRETLALVDEELNRVSEQKMQVDKLIASIQSQINLVEGMEKAFSAYAKVAIRCSKAAEGAMQLSQQIVFANLGNSELLLAYASAYSENDNTQRQGLNSLAWENGREAMSSLQPLSQRLQSVLRNVVNQMNLESVIQTKALLHTTAEGLSVQLARAQEISEGSQALREAYLAVQEGMKVE